MRESIVHHLAVLEYMPFASCREVRLRKGLLSVSGAIASYIHPSDGFSSPERFRLSEARFGNHRLAHDFTKHNDIMEIQTILNAHLSKIAVQIRQSASW